jgi:hypothetical protein
MSEKPPPIPRAIWERVLAFLRAGGTGQIVLDANRGVIRSASITEKIREPDSDEPPKRSTSVMRSA